MQVKKVLTISGVGFATFYLVTRPTDAAVAVKGAFGAVYNCADSIALFFTSLA